MFKKALLIGFLGLVLSGCSDPEKATRVLSAHGFTEITTHGYSWYGCNTRDDTIQTKFRAKAPNGAMVEGAVCNGWGWFAKGATIRIF